MQREQPDTLRPATPSSRPGRRRVSRRVLLGLALSGVLLAACQKQEQVVYVAAPTPTPEAPPALPTAAPKPESKPESKPAASAQGPLRLPVPVAAGPVPALAA